jgi:hypothetical protein
MKQREKAAPYIVDSLPHLGARRYIGNRIGLAKPGDFILNPDFRAGVEVFSPGFHNRAQTHMILEDAGPAYGLARFRWKALDHAVLRCKWIQSERNGNFRVMDLCIVMFNMLLYIALFWVAVDGGKDKHGHE